MFLFLISERDPPPVLPFPLVPSQLHLESAEDAQYVCAKAIRDGVIEAVIDHDQGTLKCKEVVDIYSTTQVRFSSQEGADRSSYKGGGQGGVMPKVMRSHHP